MKECEFDVDAMDLDYKEKFYPPSINFRNKKIPNASKKLKIRFSPEMGRHIVAVEDIKPGYFTVLFFLFTFPMLSVGLPVESVELIFIRI